MKLCRRAVSLTFWPYTIYKLIKTFKCDTYDICIKLNFIYKYVGRFTWVYTYIIIYNNMPTSYAHANFCVLRKLFDFENQLYILCIICHLIVAQKPEIN